MENIKLIDEVFKYSFIYDKSDPRHCNKEYLAKAWHNISSQLNCSAEEAKRKWTNFRDYFRRQVKEHYRQRSGDSASKRKKWAYFEQMSFLIPFIVSKEIGENLTTDSISNDNQECFSESDSSVGEVELDIGDDEKILYADYADAASTSTSADTEAASKSSAIPISSSYLPKPLASTPRPAKKEAGGTKRKMEDDVSAELLRAIKEPEPDDDEQFFKSCAPMLKLLTHEQKLELRISMQQLLLRMIRENNSERHDQRPQTQTELAIKNVTSQENATS